MTICCGLKRQCLVLFQAQIDSGFGGLMLVENGAGNVQTLAYFLNASGIVTDDLIGDGYDVAQSLRLEMANAFFKMSRSRSTRLSSASSSLTRVLREEATGPLSRSSSRFQRYNRFVPERPSRSTTDCAECPPRSICTASFLKSSVNCRRELDVVYLFFPLSLAVSLASHNKP